MTTEYNGKMYRPFNNAEELEPYLHLFVRAKDTPSNYRTRRYRICAYDANSVKLEGTWSTFGDLFGRIEFADGTPFGILVEPKWRPATQADVTVPPKTCRVRQADNDQWKPYRRLVYIYNTDSENKYLTINPNDNAQANWKYCEVME